MKTAFLFIALFLFAQIACNKLLRGESNDSHAQPAAGGRGRGTSNTAAVGRGRATTNTAAGGHGRSYQYHGAVPQGQTRRPAGNRATPNRAPAHAAPSRPAAHGRSSQPSRSSGQSQI
jgi:hypothetical protein